MHRVLERQIRRFLSSVKTEDLSADWQALISAISDTYEHFDDDRELLSRSLELSSKEFVEINKKLGQQNEIIQQKVAEKTKELEELLLKQQERDVELTKANKELKELDQRKSEFLSIVAHQLRTPLSGIKWTLDMMIKGDLGPISPEQKTSLTKSYEENERLISLIEEMLNADRIDSAKYELNLAENDLEVLVKDVVAENLSYALAKGVSIECDYPTESIPKFLFDKEKIRDVFQNLIDNSIKYSLKGGTINMGFGLSGDMVECFVKDAGIGIPVSQHDLIFSRFFRAHNAQSVDPNGNGLGLFIVKSIVELHGGTVWFESEENKGTSFHFTLKMKQ